MDEQEPKNELEGQDAGDRKFDRRQIGKFLAYTAPALVALASAKAYTY